MMNRSKLNFHESFQPEWSLISKILLLASQGFRGTKHEISEETGIPTGQQKGKVVPSVRYAAFMGLIEVVQEKGVFTLSLSKLGEEVFVQDSYLHENLSHWLCHFAICCPELGAPQWSYLVCQGHQGLYNAISSVHLTERANRELEVTINFEELFGVVKRSYTSGCFSGLHFLEWNDSVEFMELTSGYELLYVYAYGLLTLWEKLLPDKKEITIPEVQEVLSFDKIFGLQEDELLTILSDLEDEGILTLNRQLFPATVIGLACAEELISKLYSRLL